MLTPQMHLQLGAHGRAGELGAKTLQETGPLGVSGPALELCSYFPSLLTSRPKTPVPSGGWC